MHAARPQTRTVRVPGSGRGGPAAARPGSGGGHARIVLRE
jgi:hypothetical protein